MRNGNREGMVIYNQIFFLIRGGNTAKTSGARAMIGKMQLGEH